VDGPVHALTQHRYRPGYSWRKIAIALTIGFFIGALCDRPRQKKEKPAKSMDETMTISPETCFLHSQSLL
jgi:hypothetical protein